MASRVLRLIDVSSYIHAGSVNRSAKLDGPVVKTDNGYTCRDIAAGGISLLFNNLYYHYGSCDYVFCCDTRPTIKQGMFPDYKANREHKESISKAKEVARIVLEDCGFTVLCEPGYEADDFIYSAVQKYQNQYDEIVIHTSDSDLYFLVSDKVRIEKSHSRSKDVSMSSYGTSFGKDIEFMQYNMGTFYKVCFGDKSDNIPPLEDGAGVSLFNTFNQDGIRAEMGNKSYARNMVEMFADWALPQFDLVYPLDVKIPEEIERGDKDRVFKWGKAMKNKLFSNVSLAYEGSAIEAVVDDMVNMGLYDEA